MTRLLGFVLLVLSLGATLGLTKVRLSDHNAAANGQDEAAIRRLAERYAAGWNEGDAKKAAAIFADQAVYVDDAGQELKGRAAIQRDLAEVIGGPMRGTSFKPTVDGIRFLAPNVAIAYGTSQVEGGPTAPTKGHYIVTCEKNGSTWKVVALGTGLDVTH